MLKVGPFLLALLLIFTVKTFDAAPILNFGIEAVESTNTVRATSSLYMTNMKDPALQTALENVIRSNPKWKKLVTKKLMSVGLVDLRESGHARYASINGRNMVYAASLPKIAVLLAAVESIDEGCLDLDAKLDKDLRLMIAKSNNQATTRVIERLGFKKISEILQSEKYRFYDKTTGGGLWVGKKYAKAGKRVPDPMKGISHAATVEQVCRFYTLLSEGKLVSEKGNKMMMKYLINPEINHKFVKSIRKISPDAKIFRKSGSWRTYHADSALIEGTNGNKYVLVALIQDAGGSKICEQLVYSAEKLLSTSTTSIATAL